jgi:glycosyltransferase involved in cell wall biosynthesis
LRGWCSDDRAVLMLVSIVMAAWNAERWIAEAVASVVAQTHEDWELLVVDDGSDDGTAGIVEAAGDERIRLVRGSHVGVLAQVRNRGLELARGDAVALLDADDVWEPTKLARQAGYLGERADVGLVHTGAYLLDDGRRVPAPPPAAASFRSLLDENTIYSSSVLMRRELLDRHGPFDPDPALHGSPDYELWLRLAPRTRFGLVPEPLVGYRVHPAQMSGAVSAMERGALVALARAAERDPELVRAERVAFMRAIGMRQCRAGMPGRGRRELLAALRLRPWDRGTWAWLARSLRPS